MTTRLIRPLTTALGVRFILAFALVWASLAGPHAGMMDHEMVVQTAAHVQTSDAALSDQMVLVSQSSCHQSEATEDAATDNCCSAFCAVAILNLPDSKTSHGLPKDRYKQFSDSLLANDPSALHRPPNA